MTFLKRSAAAASALAGLLYGISPFDPIAWGLAIASMIAAAALWSLFVWGTGALLGGSAEFLAAQGAAIHLPQSELTAVRLAESLRGLTREGLLAMAREAVKRGTGARGLRSIFERIMLDVMYEVPSRSDVRSVSINEAVVKGERAPILKKRIERNAA